MLAGAGAVHPDRELVQPADIVPRPGELGRIVHVDQQEDVEVPVPCVPDDRRHEPVRRGTVRRGPHRLGEPPDGHAGIGADPLRAGTQGERGPVRVVPRAPQPDPLVRIDRRGEARAAVAGRDPAHRLGLLGDRGGAAVELHQEKRRLGERQPGIGVHRPHLQRIQELDPRDRHAALDHLAHRPRGLGDGRERARRAHYRLRDALEAQRDLGDHAKRALRSDHQPRQVIAGRALARACRGSDRLAAREHDAQPKDLIADRAVAHRVGPRGAGRHHPPEGSIGARIDREEQPRRAQLLVQPPARDPGLHGAVHVVRAHGEDHVHPAHVERHAPLRRVHVPLERGAGTERDHRAAVAGADAHDLAHLVLAAREHDRVGRLGLDPGGGVGVLCADRGADVEPGAEPLRQDRDRRADALGIAGGGGA